MSVYELNGKKPRIHRTARLVAGAIVAGDVVVDPKVLISWNAVVYAEEATLEIGRGACSGDGTLVHAKERPIRIGDYALIGHGAQICDATVDNYGMVGINAVAIDGACIAQESMLAGDSFLKGKRAPPRTLWAWRPAKEVGPLGAQDLEERAHARSTIIDTLREIDVEQARFE